MKKPPGGITLVVDPETGMPASLGEIVVSLIFSLMKTIVFSSNPTVSINMDVSRGILADETFEKVLSTEKWLRPVIQELTTILAFSRL